MRRPIISLTVMLFVLVATHCLAREVVYYIHNDHLGTPQIMTDQAGRIVWKAEYEPFGKANVYEDPDGDGLPVENNLGFPGQYYDAETGLHYNYHRDYDPGTGRYLEADSVGILGGTNHLYAYAGNNPIRFSDPQGLIFSEFLRCVKRMRDESIAFRKTDDLRHCYASCRIASECGLGTCGSALIGVGKEVLDLFGPGNAEFRDLINDAKGNICAKSGILPGVIAGDQECCDVGPRQCGKCCSCLAKHGRLN